MWRGWRGAGPVGKELLTAAATEGLEAFLGGAEHAAAKEAAEKAAQEQSTRDMVRAVVGLTTEPYKDGHPLVDTWRTAGGL